MNTHADKVEKSRRQSVANAVSQKQNSVESTFQFVDNRPEAIAQRKLQEMANNSPQAVHLRAFQEVVNNSLHAGQAAKLLSMPDNDASQQQHPMQRKENNTGLPDSLRTGPDVTGSKAAVGGQLDEHAATIQRYEDLAATYANSAEVSDEDKDEWLPKFQQIQLLLNDVETVKLHLSALAGYMGQHNVTLSQALAAHEAGTWTDARPILLGFVPPAVFEDFVRRGQLFVDLVQQGHGVQTHRIQWYIIKAVLGQDFAKAAYAESVHPRWKKGEKNMWDRIVDGLGAKAGDFTQPDRLEDYLLEQFKSLCSHSDLGKLRGQVSEGHESQREDKKAMKEKVPPESKYTHNMKSIMTQHKGLMAELDSLKSKEKQATGEEKAALKVRISEKEAQAKPLLREIEFERISYRSGANLLGRGGETYIFTGWILGDWDPKTGRRVPTYFLPTVAYPEGANPGETVPDY